MLKPTSEGPCQVARGRHLERSTIGKSKFEPSYFPRSGGLWSSVGLPECQLFAEALHEDQHRFEFLDPWQLLKHALGLATNLGDRFSLYYLYFDFPSDRSEAHRREVDIFNNRVGEETKLKVSTYQDVYGRLLASGWKEPGYTEYLNYLGTRYFPNL